MALWYALARQSPAFWMICAYVFLEYVRPQSIYPMLSALPLPRMTLLIALLLTLLERRLAFPAKYLWLGFVTFSAVLGLSSITAIYPSASLDALGVWVNWTILIVIIGAGIRTKTELTLLILSWSLWNLKMSQHGARQLIANGFSFDAWGVSGAPGWFRNSGEFGIEMCVFLPLVAYITFGAWPKLSIPRRLFAFCVIASVLASVIATSSRGAFLGVACVAVWAILKSPYRTRAAATVIPLVLAVWILLPDGNKARWREAGSDRDSVARLTYWKHGIEIANDFPVLGIGYANWLPYYREKYNRKGEVPHNYLIEAASQLGYTGLVAFIALTLLFFRENLLVRKMTNATGSAPDRMLWATSYGLDGAMIGFLSSGFFVTVLFYPYYWMNLALALALSRVVRRRQGGSIVGRIRMGIIKSRQLTQPIAST